MWKLAELGIVLVAAMWPLFVLAGKIDSDEFEKAILGGAGLTAISIYKMWSSRHKVQEEQAEKAVIRAEGYGQGIRDSVAGVRQL